MNPTRRKREAAAGEDACREEDRLSSCLSIELWEFYRRGACCATAGFFYGLEFFCLTGYSREMADDAVKIDVQALARLSRIDVPQEQLERLEKELPNILAFVRTVQEADISNAPTDSTSLHNVMRKDENPHESGKYTERLLAAAPARVGNRIAVKQVLSKKSRGESAEQK